MSSFHEKDMKALRKQMDWAKKVLSEQNTKKLLLNI